MNKEKLLRNQKTQKMRGLYERQRRIEFLKKKTVIKRSLRKLKGVRVKTEPTNIKQKWTLRKIVRVAIFKIIVLWKRILCIFGIHAWTLQSGLPGTPKYMCRRCMKQSKRLWEEKK